MPAARKNLTVSMHRLGFAIEVVPQPINFFTNTVIERDGRLLSPPNPVPRAPTWNSRP